MVSVRLQPINNVDFPRPMSNIIVLQYSQDNFETMHKTIYHMLCIYLQILKLTWGIKNHHLTPSNTSHASSTYIGPSLKDIYVVRLYFIIERKSVRMMSLVTVTYIKK